MLCRLPSHDAFAGRSRRADFTVIDRQDSLAWRITFALESIAATSKPACSPAIPPMTERKRTSARWGPNLCTAGGRDTPSESGAAAAWLDWIRKRRSRTGIQVLCVGRSAGLTIWGINGRFAVHRGSACWRTGTPWSSSHPFPTSREPPAPIRNGLPQCWLPGQWTGPFPGQASASRPRRSRPGKCLGPLPVVSVPARQETSRSLGRRTQARRSRSAMLIFCRRWAIQEYVTLDNRSKESCNKVLRSEIHKGTERGAKETEKGSASRPAREEVCGRGGAGEVTGVPLMAV